MANRGKVEQWGSGSRRSPQRRAEDAARRSQKRAGERRWRRDEEGRREIAGPLPSPAGGPQLAILDLQTGVREFNQALEAVTNRTDLLWTQPRI